MHSSPAECLSTGNFRFLSWVVTSNIPAIPHELSRCTRREGSITGISGRGLFRLEADDFPDRVALLTFQHPSLIAPTRWGGFSWSVALPWPNPLICFRSPTHSSLSRTLPSTTAQVGFSWVRDRMHQTQLFLRSFIDPGYLALLEVPRVSPNMTRYPSRGRASTQAYCRR